MTIAQGKTRLEVKCGASNRVTMAEVEYACKECGHKQKAL